MFIIFNIVMSIFAEVERSYPTTLNRTASSP